MNQLCCRICTQHAGSLNGQNLFERSHRKLLRQIFLLTGLKLRNTKELPQQICENCQVQLENAHRFRSNCLEAQKYFQTREFKEKAYESNYNNHGLSENRSFVEHFDTAENTAMIEEEEEFILKNESEFLEVQHENSELEYDHLLEQQIQCVDDEQRSLTVTPVVTPVKRKMSIKSRLKSRKKRTENYKQCDLICDQCGNHFSCRHHLITHLRRHTGDKPFQCEICPDKFFTNSELNRHMRKHTGERPFGCRHCGRCFSDYSTRSKHERTHTNTRPFACNQCGKAFTTAYILKNHMLTHTGERSFSCNFCNKSFQRQCHLVVHFRSLFHKQNAEKQAARKEGNEKMRTEVI